MMIALAGEPGLPKYHAQMCQVMIDEQYSNSHHADKRPQSQHINAASTLSGPMWTRHACRSLVPKWVGSPFANS